jgi:hypothetical protein
MAITVPGIDYVQLPGKSTTPLNPLIVNVHTMVGTLAGTEAWFRPPGRSYSHLGLRGDGYSRQWQDLRFRAASDLDGNPISISIECEDSGRFFPAWSGSDVPAFTPAQVEWLVVNIAWLCRRFGIPPVLTPDSLPGRTGPSYHRLGIDPWRVPGGIRYSSARGKVCPGDRRIAQMASTIVPRVALLVNGNVVPDPDPDPPRIEDLMPFSVIAAPTDDVERPWCALLPGRIVNFVDWNPLPFDDGVNGWAPGWAYYAGVESGLYLPVRRMSTARRYDEASAAARYYNRLPVAAFPPPAR